MAPDPITSDPDDPLDAQRLRAFFSTASGHPTAEARPSASVQAPTAPTPSPRLDPPPFVVGPSTVTNPAVPVASAASIRPAPTIDVVALVEYLDAELELTRRQAEAGIERVMQALDAMDARVTDVATFRAELFGWLDSYVGWEANALREIAGQISGSP